MEDQAAGLDRLRLQQSRRWLDAATRDPVLKRDAHRMLWEICQVLREPDAALAHLHAAIEENPLFTRPGRATRQAERSILMLSVPGDFQANLPLDRLFDETTDLHTFWITDPERILQDPVAATPPGLPTIDCVFIAIAQDTRHERTLQAADALAAAIGRPVINGGGRIAGLSRAGVAALLRRLPHAVVPSHHLVARGEPAPIAFPIIVRPLGSHAGHGLRQLSDASELALYYEQNRQFDQFTVAPFIDYRSGDGYWRKYRVIFVEGVPYPLHLAIHDHWAVWYYNAEMQRSEAKLAEERHFLDDLSASLPARAMLALRELGSRVGLDYFGVDCGVLPDGRLLVFELETGMIVQQRQSARDPGAGVRRAVEQMIAKRGRAMATAHEQH